MSTGQQWWADHEESPEHKNETCFCFKKPVWVPMMDVEVLTKEEEDTLRLVESYIELGEEQFDFRIVEELVQIIRRRKMHRID